MTVAHRLLLLRHAAAEPAGSAPDPLRPLALVGRQHAVRVGRRLRDAGLRPDAVLCSSAVRTRQTWDAVRPSLEGFAGEVRIEDAVYGADATGLLSLLREVGDDLGTVLVVGHEPTLSVLASTLAGTEGSDAAALAQVRAGLPTGCCAVLQAEAPWSQWERDAAALVALERSEG